jgi:spore maturation protein CgeB
MKVLISGAFWHGSLEESYARAFESIGWIVVRFDWEQFARAHPLAKFAFADKLLRTRIADRVGKWFTAIIEEKQPDLVLVIKGRRIAPETLLAAKRILYDRPMVNFNPDSPWEPANSSSRLLGSIPLYDAHFTWNKQLQSLFKNAGTKDVHYLPFAYDPLLHHPLKADLPNVAYDAMFVGTYTPERDALLGTLMNCNIRIVGNGWYKANFVPKHWVLSEAVYGEDATRALSLGACAINILRGQNVKSHNMRTFEIPATANAMLTTRSEEQSEWFTEGSDMECFATPEELLMKVRLFAGDAKRAGNIAKNGYERVREETYAKRAHTMISHLGFA